MKHYPLILLVLAAPTAGFAANSSSAVMAPIHQFIDNFNKGDGKAASAAYVSDPVIVDEVSPYVWRGPGAFAAWGAAIQNDAKSHGQSENGVTLGAPQRSDVSGGHAYVVLPATYHWRERGKLMAEPAHMTFALVNGAGGWKIASWSWAGGTPHVAGASGGH